MDSFPGVESRARCSFCGELAVIRMAESGERLCGSHFCSNLESRVRTQINLSGCFSPGDHVAVALSGGKDSSALLLLLHTLRFAWPGIELTAITIDEGIAGYREETMEAARGLASTFGIRHEIISFVDLYGKPLDRMVRGREGRACTICGVMRRHALMQVARRIGATKIATGHNRDDEAQSVLMNVLRGDLVRLLRDSSSKNPAFSIPRVKPLSFISEREVLTYLLVRGYYRDLPECPYTRSALRAEVRTHLELLEERFPGTCKRLLMLRRSLQGSAPPGVRGGALRPCWVCGELSCGEICQVCRIQQSIRD